MSDPRRAEIKVPARCESFLAVADEATICKTPDHLTITVTKASVSSVRMATNGTMTVSIKVAGATQGQQVTLYKAGKKMASGKVTKTGTVTFSGVAPASGAYTVMLSKAGKPVSRTQPIQITAPRR